MRLAGVLLRGRKRRRTGGAMTNAGAAGMAVVVVLIGACTAAAPPASTPTQPSPTATPKMTPTPTPAPTPADAGIIALNESGCGFDSAVESIPAGPITLTFANETSDLGAFHIWRLNDDSTFDEFATFISDHREQMEQGVDTGPPPFATMAGREVRTEASDSDSLSLDAAAGIYGVACIIPNEIAGRLVATYAAGPLVVGTSGATASVVLRDDGCGYSGPADIKAGTVVLELVNATVGQFDADLWLLRPGRTYDELVAHLGEEQRRLEAGEPPLGHPAFATLVAEASTASERGTLTADLDPGTYGLACIRFEGGVPVQYWSAGPFAAARR